MSAKNETKEHLERVMLWFAPVAERLREVDRLEDRLRAEYAALPGGGSLSTVDALERIARLHRILNGMPGRWT